MKELFQNTRNSTEQTLKRTPDRPLGSVSNYVVEEFPLRLASVRKGEITGTEFAGSVSAFLESHLRQSMQDLSHEPKRRDLALLDLLILETGVVHSGGEASQGLIDTVDRLAENNRRIPLLTYEDVIMINPLDEDPRTFSDEPTRQTEIDFYVTHSAIEGHMEPAIEKLVNVADILASTSEKVPFPAVEILEGMVPDFEALHDYMELVGKAMDPEKFNLFRSYFNSHPSRQLDGKPAKGPSGAFSARIPIVDILLSGLHLPEEFFSYLRENEDYFPREGQIEIDSAMARASAGLSLLDQYTRLGEPTSLGEPLKAISSFILKFRGKHYRGVQQQLPDVFQKKGAGSTGEADVPGFLKSRIQGIRHITS